LLFVGSSSIRRWDLPRSFTGLPVINRCFGGSQIADSTHFAPRIFFKHRPRVAVLYAGDNDLAAGRTPDQVLADFQDFARAVHRGLPKTRVVFLAIKPSNQRGRLVDQVRKANGLIQAYCKGQDWLSYVDVFTPMLGAHGKPRPELFAKDGLHLNALGYQLWASLVKPYLN
jgi:lysophospholipase L1-like esterase